MRHDDETTHALLESAHRVLVSEGPEALTVRRIATDAGMSTMNVYSRFGGKDGILQSLFVSGHHKLSGMLAAVVAQSDPLDELRERATTYRDFALENPAYYAVMFNAPFPSSRPATSRPLSPSRPSTTSLSAWVVSWRVVIFHTVTPSPQLPCCGLRRTAWSRSSSTVSDENDSIGPRFFTAPSRQRSADSNSIPSAPRSPDNLRPQ